MYLELKQRKDNKSGRAKFNFKNQVDTIYSKPGMVRRNSCRGDILVFSALFYCF